MTMVVPPGPPLVSTYTMPKSLKVQIVDSRTTMITMFLRLGSVT
jgi:hypothetical protein